MERDKNGEREPENKKLKEEFMYEEEVRKAIENLLECKCRYVGINMEEFDTATASELTRMVSVVTGEDATARLSRKAKGAPILFKHKSILTPNGFRLLDFEPV